MLMRIGRMAAQATLPALVLLFAWWMTDALIGEDEGGLAGAPNAVREVTYAVRAVDVTLSDNRATFRAFGEVEAVGAAELRVASPGEVVGVHENLAVGSVVDAGATLVTIDPFEYEGALREARAELSEARARTSEAEARVSLEDSALQAAAEQLDLAQRDLDRAERLSEAGTLADRALDDRRLLVSQRQQAVDQRAFTLEAERARLAQQEAAVERLAWQVERAERALADTVLKAPFDAIVRAENVEVGRILSANDMAVSLIRAGTLDVSFTMSDQRYGRLLASGGGVIGRDVEVVWRIGDQPVRLPATITRTAADITMGTGGIELFARIDMDDAGPARPRPGAFVEVSVPGPAHEESVRVAATALYDDAVFVIDADDRLEQRVVQVLARDGTDVILSGQLSDGDAVITTRLAEAGAGIKVDRVGDAPPSPAALAANDPAEAGEPTEAAAPAPEGEAGEGDSPT